MAGTIHERLMALAIDTAERARGATGDNPWVGCVIVDRGGDTIATGYTQGPGEDHAEIHAAHNAAALGRPVAGATLYSTLEPCSFHGRTPACAHAIAGRGFARVVIGMRDPHPRVDGAGIHILRAAGVEVIEGVLEAEVRKQLGAWVFAQHSHEPTQRAQRRLQEGCARADAVHEIAALYGVDPALAAMVVDRARHS